MRNVEGRDSGSWATYAKAAREATGLGKTEFARRIGVDRGTVHRWEIGRTKPEDPEVVRAFAEASELDLDEALAAAGLRPGVTAPAEPTRKPDEEIELVRTDPRLDPDMKQRIIAVIMQRRERDRQRSMEETRQMIELMRRPD